MCLSECWLIWCCLYDTGNGFSRSFSGIFQVPASRCFAVCDSANNSERGKMKLYEFYKAHAFKLAVVKCDEWKASVFNILRITFFGGIRKCNPFWNEINHIITWMCNEMFGFSKRSILFAFIKRLAWICFCLLRLAGK